ncbi:MAG: amino acid adenylation domain-containing protein [Clostridia bacterium]
MNDIESRIHGAHRNLSEIGILSEDEKRQLLVDFNNTYTEYPRDVTVNELFEAQVERTPNSIAVRFEDKQLTYRELNDSANRVAEVLRKKGVRPDKIVGIMVERSFEMIVGIMGILKAGGAYMPIEPGYPQDRIKYMLEDSGVNILLTQQYFKELIAFEGETIILDDEKLYEGTSTNLETINNAGNLAYVIYTSGSTGKPKGVMIEHRAIINRLKWMQKKYPIGANDVILQKTPYTFDVSVWELLWWSLEGSSVCFLAPKEERDPESIMNAINKYAVTTIHFVPSMLNTFLEHLEESNDIDRISTLKRIFASGEALSIKHVEKTHEVINKKYGTQLHNLYGPTEAAVDVSYFDCFEEETDGTVPIGKPIDNIKLYIIDKDSKLQPVGVPGELCIAGDGLARGYINKPELTSEKFVENPFKLGARMYKTGDLAKWLPDGNIEFLGRIDHQVKIRGFRIELGEIENQLLSHKDIREAVVAAKEDGSGSKYLCAYIAADRQIAVRELMEQLSKELPSYMIPSFFVYLDKLPLTLNGKIDRKALPEPDRNSIAGTEYEEPRNELEEKLVDIWKEVLGVSEIGINDNFFEFGGHSLKAISLTAKTHKKLGVEIPLKEIFDTPTVKGLSGYIRSKERNVDSIIQPVEEKEYHELSSAQKRLYTLQQLEIDGVEYNLPSMLMMEGNLDILRLKKSFDKLIERHEAFRTSFVLVGETVLQKIHKKLEFEIEYAEASEEEIEGKIKGFVRAFDLSKAPLLRVGLIKVCPGKYLLMYDMHHIISDGISQQIMMEEFVKLYQGHDLPELRIQYKDYAVWQSKLKNTEEMKRKEKYWLKQFEGEIPVLNISTDYPRPAVQSFEGDSVNFELDNEMTEGLRRIAREAGVTMYMVLLAAFNILLSKYSGQEDIVVGCAVAGRTHADLENIVGMFVNTLAMRNYPEGKKTIREFLNEIKINALEAYENQDYQFEELVEKLGKRRDMSRNPLFDVALVLQNMETAVLNIEGLNIKEYKEKSKVSKFNLTVEAVEGEEGFEVKIEYCSELFNKETIERMADHLKQVFISMTNDLNKQLKDIELITAEERNMLLYELNNTFTEYPRDKTIHELFEEQVERTPDNVAVVYEDKQLTYRELNERANQLGRILREKGVTADSIVGIMVERSLDMMIGIMGILKAGGAYLPIDPEYPKDRIEYMLEDSKVKIMLTGSEYYSEIQFKNINRIDIKEVLNNCDIYEENLGVKYDYNRAFYVIYTSGSIGNPKGAAVKSHSFTNLMNWFTREFEIGDKDNILLIAPVSFDLAQKNLYASLIKGGKLCILPENLYDQALDLIHKYSITMVNCTPSTFHMILESVKNQDFTKLKTLRYVFLGGEPINISKLISWIKSPDYSAEIVNTYGPTECTDISSFYRIPNKNITTIASVPIGKPIDNVKLYIVDKYQNLAIMGQPGELCVGGISLGIGYLNRPELTAEKFVPNPFEPGTRMYRTGDLARWLPDGNIEFLGRIDHQVKIRGFRIELGEIESQLLSHANIKEAVVIAREEESGSKYLCAYIVGDKEVTVGELREHLSKVLPDYMIPPYFIQLEKMPLTPNGKIDRKALPEPDGSITTGVEFEAARNEVEEKLVTIWKEVLKADRVGINDNFFDLGGHSLKATSMAAKIHKEFEVNIPLKEIFKSPTIKGVASYIMSSEKDEVSVIQPVERRDYYPTSSAQKRIYIIDQMEENRTSYTMPEAILVEGELDRNKLEKIFKELVNRHEAFRTSFEMVNGEIVQRIHQNVDFDVEYSEYDDLDNLDEGVNGLDALKNKVAEFFGTFDLSKAPLIRIGLMKISSSKHILMSDMHHIVSDGVSSDIFLREFIDLYNGKEIPELKTQYKDYAVWQSKDFTKAIVKKQEAYWTNVFKGALPLLNLPTDFIRPPVQKFDGEIIGFPVDRKLMDGLRTLVTESNATLFMLFLAAYNVLLSRYTGQEDIIVGTPAAGRTNADVENMIGAFINTLAFRGYPTRNKTFKDFFLEVRDNTLLAYENQDYQFEELLEKLKLPRDLSRNPLFTTMFAVRNLDEEEIIIPGLRFIPFNYTNDEIAKLDINLGVVKSGDKTTVNFNYRKSLFNKETIQRMGLHYLNILQEIVADPCIRIGEINLFSQEEKDLIAGSGIELDKNIGNTTLHGIFEEQAIKKPDNTAVIYGHNKLTYEDLNKRANKLARVLRKKGIRPDNVVGIMLDYSEDLVVGALAVLKAGGAFLLLDPAYSDEKVTNMLVDTNACLLLSRKSLLKESLLYRPVLDIECTEIDAEDDKCLENVNKPSDLVYVTYTSGVTGEAKAVMLEHANVVSLLSTMDTEYPCEVGSTYILTSPYTSNVIITELFGWILNSGRLIICNEEESRNKEKLISLIDENKVTHISFTPPMMDDLFDTMPEFCVNVLNKMKYILLSGDIISKSLREKLHLLSKDVRIEYIYGVLESTSYSIKNSFDGFDYTNSTFVGRPLDNAKAYVLDNDMNILPSGVVGELYIAGNGVARGYAKKTGWEEAGFVNCPFNYEERMFKTGDLARMLPDGSIELLSRKVQQYYINGLRIELEKIRLVLEKKPSVKRSIVITNKNTYGDARIIAYIVPNGRFESMDLKEYLLDKIPQYMIPSSFIELERVPLLSNGKINVNALINGEVQDSIEKEMVAPRNEIEEELMEVWKEVLGINEISVYDNFFQLGGTSIKVLQVVALLENYTTGMRELFRYPTIAELSKRLQPIICDSDNQNPMGMVSQYYLSNLETLGEDDEDLNLPKQKILENVQPFNDVFYRGCFYHSLFPALRYLECDIKSILANELITYTYQQEEDGVGLSVKYDEINDMDMVLEEAGVKCYTKVRCVDIIKDVKRAISKNRPTIVSTDCYYEPIRNDMYMKNHWWHCISVFGYDDDNQMCNVIEQSDLNSLDFKKYLMSYEDVRNSYNGYLRIFLKGQEFPTYYEYDVNVANTCEHIISRKDYRDTYAKNLLARKEMILDGIEYLLVFIENFKRITSSENLISQNCSDLLFTFGIILTRKQSEKYKIIQFFGSDNQLCDLSDEIASNWNLLRAVVQKYYISKRYKSSTFEKLLINLNRIYECEKQYYKILFELCNERSYC